MTRKHCNKTSFSSFNIN